MSDSFGAGSLLVFFLGLVIVLAPLIRAGAERLQLPSLAGYILIGVGLSAVDGTVAAFPDVFEDGLSLFAQIGVVVLLFRVGLESEPALLARQIPRASAVWLGDVTVSGGLGFVTSHFLLGYGLVPSLFVAAALSATSVGVSTAAWREAGALRSEKGALLTDVAELDDISAVFLMTLLFGLAPLLEGEGGKPILGALGWPVAWLTVKFLALTVACLVFSLFLERRLTRSFARFHGTVGPLLLVTGCAFMIAAATEWLGFSLAIGAVFAGLAFSRDPSERQIDTSFEAIYDLFGPFFFIGIGFAVDVTLLDDAAALGTVLIVAAVLGKLAGAGIPASVALGGSGGLLIGASMIPRAEIALIIMEHGLRSGGQPVPSALYSGMVFVTLGTCVLVPPVVLTLVRRSQKSVAK